MSSWPRDYHPLDEQGQPDTTVTVALYPLEAGRGADLRAWCGGDLIGSVNGAPAVIAPGPRPVSDRVAGLGDVIVRHSAADHEAVPGGQLSARYQPADVDEAPPVD